MLERKNAITSEKIEENNSVKAEFVKMLKRTQQQITEAKNRKEIAIETYSRELQQLHKDQDRLVKIIEKLK